MGYAVLHFKKALGNDAAIKRIEDAEKLND
ncbi:hypothetical protein EZS27_022855 [termite gut metagenome]|jgi:hypothetical protein|uniref:Uncharacterized protein n=1 Tax=termite gut metagenome TaxID=433724 RepID=A0A5J4R3X4_9ZZZZ